jgi:hypothetical protein
MRAEARRFGVASSGPGLETLQAFLTAITARDVHGGDRRGCAGPKAR